MTRRDKGDLDIPDFVEDRTDSDSIDMSIFKMSDEELYDDVSGDTKVYSDDYDDYDDEPKRGKNTTLILCFIIIGLLLLALAGSIFYGLNQHQAYVKANTAYLQMQANEANYKKQIADQATTIETLSKELEEAKNPKKGEGNIVYEITDGPISFRNEPSRDGEIVSYNGSELAGNGEKYNVIEVVKGTDDPDYSWAKVADNVYFCLGTADDVWAKKVD